VYSATTGFVQRLDLDHIQRAIDAVPGECEVVLDVSIGGFVAYGDLLTRDHSVDKRAGARVAPAVERAVRRERQRDVVRLDAAYGIEQFETVGWTSLSGAKHNPQAARNVVAQLRDVLARFSATVADDSAADTAIVYSDDVPDALMKAFDSSIRWPPTS
jgi:uncharacterized membrane protein